MHFKSLTSIAFLGLAVIAPLALAHPSETSTKLSSYNPYKPNKPTKPTKTNTPTKPAPTNDIDLADCYHVSSPECDKAYDDNLAAYLKAHPDYNPDLEPYPDSKRHNNICKCAGSLLDGGYSGLCKYGDGFGYTDSACFPARGMCCTWCCRDAIDGYADDCVATNQDPNCPGYGPDSKDH